MKKLRILPVLLSGLIISLFFSCEKPIEYYSYQKLNKLWQVQSASSAEPLSSIDLSKCKPKAKLLKNESYGCFGELTLRSGKVPKYILNYRVSGDNLLVVSNIVLPFDSPDYSQTPQWTALKTDLQGTWTYTLSGDTLTLSRSSDKAKMVWVSK